MNELALERITKQTCLVCGDKLAPFELESSLCIMCEDQTMFLFHLRDVLLGVAVFSLPALLLELQLLVIGLNGMSVNVMIATVAIGLLSAIGAVVIETIEG